jgi:N-terminal domain of anti-restriction factor ArdC
MTAKTASRPRKPARAKYDPEARAAQFAALSAQLEEWEGDAGEEMIAAALAMHDGYSPRNAMLIAMQDPQATEVRGYVAWQDQGRQVGTYPEGEHGITIVSFKGEAKAAEQAEEPAAAKPADAEASDGEQTTAKPSRRFGLGTVHDVRFTTQIVCGTCGRKIHRTGADKNPRFSLWAHDEMNATKAGHEARPPRKGEEAPAIAAS